MSARSRAVPWFGERWRRVDPDDWPWVRPAHRCVPPDPLPAPLIHPHRHYHQAVDDHRRWWGWVMARFGYVSEPRSA